MTICRKTGVVYDPDTKFWEFMNQDWVIQIIQRLAKK